MMPEHDIKRPATASTSRRAANTNTPLSSNTFISDWFQPRLLDTTMQLMLYQPVEPARVLAKRFFNEHILLAATDPPTRQTNKDNSNKTKAASATGSTGGMKSSQRGSVHAPCSPALATDGMDEDLVWSGISNRVLIPYGVEALSSYFMPQPHRQASNELGSMLATIIVLLHQQGQHFTQRAAAAVDPLTMAPPQTCHVTPLCHEAVDELPLTLLVYYVVALIKQELRDIVPEMGDAFILIILSTALQALRQSWARASAPDDDWAEVEEVPVVASWGEADLFSSRLRLLSASHLGLLTAHFRETIQRHFPLKVSPDVLSLSTAALGTRSGCPEGGEKANSCRKKTQSKVRRSPLKTSPAAGGESTLSDKASSSQDEICAKMKVDIEDLVRSCAVMVNKKTELFNNTVSASVAERVLHVVSVLLSAVVQVGVPMVGLLTFHGPEAWTSALQARCTGWLIDGLMEGDDIVEGGYNSKSRIPHTDGAFRKLLRDLALIVKSVDASSGEKDVDPTADHRISSSLAKLLGERLSTIIEPASADEGTESSPNLWSGVLLWVTGLVEVCIQTNCTLKQLE